VQWPVQYRHGEPPHAGPRNELRYVGAGEGVGRDCDRFGLDSIEKADEARLDRRRRVGIEGTGRRSRLVAKAVEGLHHQVGISDEVDMLIPRPFEVVDVACIRFIVSFEEIRQFRASVNSSLPNHLVRLPR
jgi:hypothetical protein